MKKKKDEEERKQKLQVKKHQDDDFLESSDSEGPSQQYLNSLYQLYQQDPDQLSKYQITLIQHLIDKDKSNKKYNDDDFESDYHNESDVIEKVRDFDEFEWNEDQDESSEGVTEEKHEKIIASNL